MTIDEIKQALRETKDICAFNRTCTTCPLGIDSGGSKICPMRYLHPDFVRPFAWPLDWPEDARIAKANATASLTLNDYQRMARRTAGTKKKSDKMEEALFGLSGEVGELCDHYKKYMHQGHDIDYDHMAEEAGDVLWYLAEIADALGLTLERSPCGTLTSCASATRTGSTRSAASTGRKNMKITLEIPDGPRCCFSATRRCKLCSYAEHLQAYNFRLYGRLLKGGKYPVKCMECEEGANGKDE